MLGGACLAYAVPKRNTRVSTCNVSEGSQKVGAQLLTGNEYILRVVWAQTQSCKWSTQGKL